MNDPSSTNPYAPSVGVPLLPAPPAIVFQLKASTGEFPPEAIAGCYRNLVKQALIRPVSRLVLMMIYLSFVAYMITSVGRIMWILAIVFLQCAVLAIALRYLQQSLLFRKINRHLKSAPVDMVGYENGLQMTMPGYEQFNLWPIVQGAGVFGEYVLLLFPGVVSRAGVILESIQYQSETTFDSLHKTISNLSKKQALSFGSPKLIGPHGFDSPRWSGASAVFSGTIPASHLAKLDPASWKINVFYSAWLFLTIVLFGGYCVYETVSELLNPVRPESIGAHGIMAFFSILILFKLRLYFARMFRLVCFPNTCASEFEVSVYEQGFEVRTNCSHIRVLWSFFSAPHIDAGKLTAVCNISGEQTTVFDRQLFLVDSDWDQVCRLAIQSIPAGH